MPRPIAIAAALVLTGCIPPTPRSAADDPPPPVVATVPTPAEARPPLTLDLTNLREPPAWEARPVVARAVNVEGERVHIVATGETGIAIARAYAIPWSQIITANALVEPFTLRVGQRLRLPGGTAPPSLETRAAAFRLDIDDLVSGAAPATARTATAAPVLVAPPSGNSSGATRFAWPASGAVTGRFGPRGSGRVNQGIDIAAAPASVVRATAAGNVVYVGRGVPTYGGLILIAHPGSWISAYGRIGSASVAKGDAVRGGQAIGTVDRVGPLQFQLRRSRVAVDPLKQLPRR